MNQLVWPSFSDIPQPESRAPRYAAAHCRFCGETISLVLDGTMFRCRDSELCERRQQGLQGIDEAARTIVERLNLERYVEDV